MKVVFFTEGGKKRGLGHVTRCLSVAQAFQERDRDVEFVISGDSSVESFLTNVDYSFGDWQKENFDLKKHIGVEDIAIVDSYTADESRYVLLSRQSKCSVFFDDFSRLDYPEGFIVNAAVHAENLAYQKRPGQNYLLGVKYIPLRQSFWDIQPKVLRDDLTSLLVVLGGSDLGEKTAEIVEYVSRYCPFLKKIVFLGRDIIMPQNFFQDKGMDLTYYPYLIEEKFVQVMRDVDVAISAAGQTLYELARIGLPTIVIGIAYNQKQNIDGFHVENAVEFAGWWHDENLMLNLKICIDKLRDKLTRKKWHDAMVKLVDGQGARRMVQTILASQEGT
jgi:spore coat polysaccharide biosynthesis predicted glycosyltransferase SpsG